MNLEAIISQPAEALILLQKQAEIIGLYTKEIESLKERIEWLTRQIFGRKSERFNPNQLSFDFLIDAIENRPPLEPADAVETQVSEHTRKSAPHGRSVLPDHLDKVIVEVDIPEEQKILSDGRERQRIGYDDSRKLAYEPGRFYVKITRRYKYDNPPGSEGSGVLQAPLPEALIPRCLADETLLAHVAVSKYGDHLPAYRLEQIFKRSGIHIARQTVCGWLVALGIALWPLVIAMKRELFKAGLIHSDDTPVDLLEADDRKPDSKNIRKARMWVSCTGLRDGPWTVFDFTVTREAEGPKRFFGNYSGKIVCDAYSGYGSLSETGKTAEQIGDVSNGIVLYGCWAHTRRYFFNAYKGGDRKHGAEFVALIKMLYDVEEEIRKDNNISAEEILAVRQKKSRPALDAIKQKIDTLLPITPPKSLLGKALNYASNYWNRLTRYVDDPQAPIDNNAAENAIRPIALGRKNWLFIGSRESGEAAANIMSIICTCKRAGVEPYAYLLDVIRRLPSMKTSELDSLLPTNWSKPQPAEKT
jgi:transposase